MTQSRVIESSERTAEIVPLAALAGLAALAALATLAALAALAGELVFFFSSRRTLAY